MTFSFYELALNPAIQRRLQQEINQVLMKYNGKLTYDGLAEMDYLDWLVQGWLHFLNFSLWQW